MKHYLWLLLVSTAGLWAEDKVVNLQSLLQSDPGKALEKCQKVLEMNPQDGMAHLVLCQYYTDHKQNLSKATKHGKKAAKFLPKKAEAHYRYAVALRHKMNKNRMSAMAVIGPYKDSLDRAIELDRQFHPAYREKIGFLLNAPAIAGGSKEKAALLAEKHMKVDRFQGLTSLAMVQNAKKDYEGALASYRELMTLKPTKPDYAYQTGFTLQSMERYQEAAKVFDETFEKHAHYSSCYQAARSRILGEFELEQAVTMLDHYIAEKPKDQKPSEAAAYWRKGMALEGLNKKEHARTAYQKALDLDPKFEQAQESLAKLAP